MNAIDDGTLLRRFAEEAEEGAFRELVARHLPLVHAVAARQLGGDAQLAEDVALTVFALLARRARRLAGHPTVAGWLFTAARNTAANLRRARVRRARQEQESALMNSGDEATGEADALWREVRPVLDDAVARLGAAEREALLLRFFEGASYGQIAARCGLKENTARMRVERTLEKLRAALARRGVGPTAAALGAAMSAHGAPSLAAGMAGSVATQALASASAAGGAAVSVAAVADFMGKAKVLATVAVVAVGVALYEGREARRQAQEARDWQARAAAGAAELAKQRLALAEAMRRAQAADEDNARLVGAIGRAGERLGAADAAQRAQPKISRVEAERRFNHAKALVAEGHYADALKEFLWCFDVGMRGFAYFDYRYSELPAELAKLGEKYPATIEELRQRRTDYLQRAAADDHDMDAIFDFALLSKALRDPAAIVDAMNRFPAGDSRRGTLLSNGGYDALLEARNYTALASEKPFEKMAKEVDFYLAMPLADNADDNARASYRQSVLKNAARDFEVLLGAGDEAHARSLAAKLLAAEGTAPMRAALVERAKRAGRAEWKLP